MLKDREIQGHEKKGPQEVAICAGCSGKIVDRYYLRAVDRPWHSSCLRCCECKLPLETELSCFSREGNIYCKEDYYRMFSLKRCTRCLSGISANELVMRAKECVYHLHCFVCSSCGKAFTKGEQFGMRDGLIYCRYHYEQTFHADYYDLEGAHFPNNHNSIPPFYSTIPVAGPQKGRPRKRKGLDSDISSQQQANIDLLNSGDLSSMDGLSFDASMTSPGTGVKHQARTKRMRTSFKHHQLRTMKSYFALNQNPDAKDLKQLAQKTGLSKRVLQVWFQNARAKWRRTVMRQEGQNSSSVEKSPNPNNNSASRTTPVSSSSVSPNSLNELLPDALGTVPSQPQFPDISLGAHQDESQSLSFSELYG